MLARAQAVAADLRKAGLSVLVDDDESKGPGFKYFEYELAGVCLRMELGPKDLAKGACVLVRRDDRSKEIVPLDQAVAVAQAKLEAMQTALLREGPRLPRRPHLRGRLAGGDEGPGRRRLPGRAVVRRAGLRGADQGGDGRRHLAQPALQSQADARQAAWCAASRAPARWSGRRRTERPTLGGPAAQLRGPRARSPGSLPRGGIREGRIAGSAAFFSLGDARRRRSTAYALLTSNGRIGTLKVTTEGTAVDVDWRVDDNGRGPKIREHIVLGPAGLPLLREISGTGEIGAPVKETFSVEKGRARWTSLDDSGEAEAGTAIYLDNRGSPWSLAHELRVLLGTKGSTRPALPAGTVRLEKLRTVTVGAKKERLDAYAIWGLGLDPELVLARGQPPGGGHQSLRSPGRGRVPGELRGAGCARARAVGGAAVAGLGQARAPGRRAGVDHPREVVRPADRKLHRGQERGGVPRPDGRGADRRVRRPERRSSTGRAARCFPD